MGSKTLTRMDLAEAVEFDRQAAEENIKAVRPNMAWRKVSAKTGHGMDQWLELVTACPGRSG